MTCDERRDLMPLYVADALDAPEREEVRRHLATGCVACAGWLAEAQATFAALPLALDRVAPSPELLGRIMYRIDRQDGAMIASGSTWRSFWRVVPFAAAACVLVSVGTYVAVDRRDRAAMSQVQIAYNTDAKSALLQATLADREQTLETLHRKLADQQQLVDALQSNGSRVIDLAGSTQPKASARLVWAPAAGHSVFLAQNLTVPQAGRTYELWYIPAGKSPVPAGTFGVDAAGAAVVVSPIPAGFPPLAVAAVTDEPAGGSTAPTTTPFLAGKFE